MSADRDLHALAACVHTALVCGHVLGICYAITKHHKGDGLAHVLGVIFSGRATRHHLRKCRC